MNFKINKTLSLALVGAILVSFTASVAHADCKDAYANEIKRLDGMLNPTRTGLASSGATAIAIPITMAAVHVAIAPVAIIAAPAAVTAVAIFYGVVEGIKHSYMKTLQLIKNSEKGTGKFLTKATNHIRKKNPDVTEAAVSAAVNSANQKNEFCQENANGKVKLFFFAKVRRMVALNLANATSSVDAAPSSETAELNDQGDEQSELNNNSI